MSAISVSDFYALEKARSISGPIFSELPLSGAHESCLVSDSSVGRFVPESPKPRISSESDSAALAPLQQDFCVLEDRLVHNLSTIATLKSVQPSLRERSPGVWRVGGVPRSAVGSRRTLGERQGFQRVPGSSRCSALWGHTHHSAGISSSLSVGGDLETPRSESGTRPGNGAQASATRVAGLARPRSVDLVLCGGWDLCVVVEVETLLTRVEDRLHRVNLLAHPASDRLGSHRRTEFDRPARLHGSRSLWAVVSPCRRPGLPLGWE